MLCSSGDVWRADAAPGCQPSPDFGFWLTLLEGSQLMSAQCCWLQVLLVRQLIPFSLKKLVSLARFRTKAAKSHFFQDHQGAFFYQGLPLFIFPFCYCSMPDRHFQSSREDSHCGGQPGVNLSNFARCPSDLGLPACPQLFSICCWELSGPRTSIITKRQFRGLHFSPSFVS